MKEKLISCKKYLVCEACDFPNIAQKLALQCEYFCNKHYAWSTKSVGQVVRCDKEKEGYLRC